MARGTVRLTVAIQTSPRWPKSLMSGGRVVVANRGDVCSDRPLVITQLL